MSWRLEEARQGLDIEHGVGAAEQSRTVVTVSRQRGDGNGGSHCLPGTDKGP